MLYNFSSIAPAAQSDVFGWHTRPGAFARLQPPWMPVQIQSEAASLQDGQTVLELPGRLKWPARHDSSGFVEQRQFVDELIPDGFTSWPIAFPVKWRHTHEFETVGTDHTLVRDRVETNMPAAVVKRMFAYRHEQLACDLAAHHSASSNILRPLTVAITGSSGLIGSALSAFLTTGGHRVVRLVRRASQHPDERHWDPVAPDPELFDGIDAVMHLAGVPIAGRFTEAHKARIWESRVPATRRLANVMAQTPDGPKILLCASAVGYYGADRADEELTETSPPGEDFLAELVTEWEAATQPASDSGIRVVNVRTGIVQSAAGGMLAPLRRLYAAGLGGKIGDGQQWMSWIGLDDLVYIYHRALTDATVAGPVNATAPQPVRNTQWSTMLARVLRRPEVFPVPLTVLRLLLGSQGADEFAAASQRVVPAALNDLGHHFVRPELEEALRHELGHHRNIYGVTNPVFSAAASG